MIRFLQLCDEHGFSCEVQQRWLRMANAQDFKKSGSVFKQMGRTVALLVLEIQNFFAYHPDKIPSPVRIEKPGPKMKEAVEAYWQGNETVKAQLEKHLDRLYYQLFAKDQTCLQTRGEEQSPIDGSRADTLHATTNLDTSCTTSGKASFAFRQGREVLSEKQQSFQGLWQNTQLDNTHETLPVSLRSGSPFPSLGPWCSKLVHENAKVGDLLEKWRFSPISLSVIIQEARQNHFPRPMQRYLHQELLPGLPEDKKYKTYSVEFVTPPGMDIVLGYFLLVLTKKLPAPPLSPKDDRRVLEDFGRTLEW